MAGLGEGAALWHLHSFYSLREGVDSPEQLAYGAREAGYGAAVLTDRFSLSGGVRWVKAAREVGIRPLLGMEVEDGAGDRLLLVGDGPTGYASLCRLLTAAHLDHPRGQPRVERPLLEAHAQGVVALLGTRRGRLGQALLRGDRQEAERAVEEALAIWGRDRLALVLERLALPGEGRLEAGMVHLAEVHRLPLVAAPPVRHLRRESFWLADLLACLKEGVPLQGASPRRPLNAEAYLWPVPRLVARYRGAEAALREAWALAQRLAPPFEVPSRLKVPEVPLPPGIRPEQALERAVAEGVRRRYGEHPPAGLEERLRHELGVIEDLGYAGYFLLVADVVDFARRSGIRFSGRGSSADSAVAYVLGITEVDAHARGLLFERFLSRERGEKPDIDVDFDARQRDRVAEYVARRYGAERVAAVGTLSTYRARSAVRELGAVLGFSPAELDRLAKNVPDVPADALLRRWADFPELKGREEERRRYALLWRAAAHLAGAPRFPSTHLGGVVIADRPLTELAPLMRNAKDGITLLLDKDDVEDLGLIKLDLLSLRALSALERTVQAVGPQAEAPPPDDPATYARIRRGETIGVFQLASPAQRALQARLGAETLEDLIHSVALIRPGPIKGNMVDPYVARRRGEEPVTYLHPRLRPILEKTYGVVLFQEQVIQIAVEVAGFSPGEADRLRRVMSHARSAQEMERLGARFREGARRQGVEPEVAARIFDQLRGYASYGFCEAHAAAFGALAYRTAYLLEHAPAASLAALLAEQPMGYYPPWVLVTEIRRRGLALLPVDINRSDAFPRPEGEGIRLGLAQVAGVGEATARRLVEARPAGGYASLEEVRTLARPDREALENLVRVGAFDGLGMGRRPLLMRALAPPGQATLGDQGPPEGEDFSVQERRRMEVELLGFEPGPSIWEGLRPELRRRGLKSSAEGAAAAAGARIRVAGWPFRPHRPPTRSGRPAAFFSLVDETGLLDAVCFAEAYRRYGHLLFRRPLPPLVAEGRLQVRGEGRVLRVESLAPLRLEEAHRRTLEAWRPPELPTPQAGR